MSGRIHLTIATPAKLVVDSDAVSSLRAEDLSGSFGILPGHADLLTVLPASLVRWRVGESETSTNVWYYCAIRAGVFEVTGGNRIAIACRQAVLGNDLETLEAEIRNVRSEELEMNRQARVEQLRIHTLALRQIVQRLLPGGSNFPPRDTGKGSAA